MKKIFKVYNDKLSRAGLTMGHYREAIEAEGLLYGRSPGTIAARTEHELAKKQKNLDGVSWYRRRVSAGCAPILKGDLDPLLRSFQKKIGSGAKSYLNTWSNILYIHCPIKDALDELILALAGRGLEEDLGEFALHHDVHQALQIQSIIQGLLTLGVDNEELWNEILDESGSINFDFAGAVNDSHAS